MTKYAIIDLANMFYRARHVARGDAFTKTGMAVHICFKSMRKLFREAQVEHMVFATEGHSWRYKEFPQYKGDRKLERQMATAEAKEEEKIFNEVMQDLINFLAEKTRVTVLNSPGVEGDDWMARWTQLHPHDEHIILTSDSDLVQLLAPNVTIYDGVAERWLKPEGVFNVDNEPLVFNINTSNGKVKVVDTVAAETKKWRKPLIEKRKAILDDIGTGRKAVRALKESGGDATSLRTKEAALAEAERNLATIDAAIEAGHPWQMEPEWWRHALFVKMVRGDTGDSIFSAYPGVRYNGSKNKVGIREAWDDRNSMGFNWNNFMLQRWSKLISVDKDGNKITEEVRVIDEFKRNERLIDLTKQPDHIRELMDNVIVQAIQKEPVSAVGINFLRFCNKYDLPELAREAQQHAAYLNAGYR